MAHNSKFPSAEYIQAFKDKLNSDERYGKIAQNWEGDIRLIVEPEGTLTETVWVYFDLWHGKCRDAYIEDQSTTNKPAFVLKAPYGNFLKLLSGEVGPMQALMTRMINMKGNMAVLMRNVPTVIDFVRCGRDVDQLMSVE